MPRNNRHLLIVSTITLVNALGYGIVIPLLFVYSSKYGFSALTLGILFSVYSIFELISTPFIGILSDKFGRRPLLIISLLGTAGSFFLMAFAPSGIFLFIARALDGITAGDFPVAQAVISDSTEKKDRAKGFGIIGACYGIGLIAGPAISALTVGISIKLPFIIAGVLSTIAVVMTILFLEETNKHMGIVQHKKIFDWGKLVHAVLDRTTGLTLLVSFLWSFAFGMFVYTYQSFALKTLFLSPTNISLTFLLFGIVSLLTQLFIVSRLSKKMGSAKALTLALAALTFSFLIFLLGQSVTAVIIAIIALAVSNTLVQTLIQTLLSEETLPERQGEIMGVATSYNSVGQIVGPILAGCIAIYGVSYSFVVSAFLIFIGFIVSRYIRNSI